MTEIPEKLMEKAWNHADGMDYKHEFDSGVVWLWEQPEIQGMIEALRFYGDAVQVIFPGTDPNSIVSERTGGTRARQALEFLNGS